MLQNDKLELLKPGSLQHLGDNMLAFLVETALSANLSSSSDVAGKDRDAHMYFDILVTKSTFFDFFQFL